MSKRLINPEELYDGAAFGMSQATVEAEMGLVFVSGQVAWNHRYETTEDFCEAGAPCQVVLSLHSQPVRPHPSVRALLWTTLLFVGASWSAIDRGTICKSALVSASGRRVLSGHACLNG